MLREDERVLADLVRHRDGLTLQEAHVAVHVTDHLHVRRDLVVLVDEEPDRGAEARSETASRQERNLLHFFRHLLISLSLYLGYSKSSGKIQHPKNQTISLFRSA